MKERVFVWTGGALFVTALAVCAYSYVITWATPPAAGTSIRGPALAFDVLLFSLFAAHHSIFARGRVKHWLARRVPERLLRSVYVWVASLLLVIVCVSWQRIGGDLYNASGWRAAVHAGVQLVGLWLIARSVGAIDAIELAGIRREIARESLQVAGPYRWVRHPLYLGWMLAAFGAAHMTGDRLAFAAITSIYLVLAIPWEERSLTRTFGAEYEGYKRRVPWRVVPFLY